MSLNDLEKQSLVRNEKLIRAVHYERAASDALRAIDRLKDAFHACYKPGEGSSEMFNRMELYIKTLSKLTPKVKKP